ncbi:MAG TPA: FAD-binding oxidoreductase [Dehalococcoidia bacterium]
MSDVITARITSSAAQDVDRARYAVDGMLPDIVVAPTTEEELSRSVREVSDAGAAAIVVGGAQHLSLGNIPSSYDVALSTEHLRDIVAHEPADLTVTCEPGVRLADLERVLAPHNQYLPLDAFGDSTIGGVIAANVFGPMRHAHGTVRDWLIGIRTVQPDGIVTKAGGRVVKNVTGYEMMKLHCGALGTLGVISQATFKLAPLPAATTTVAVACGSAAEGAALILAARDAGLAMRRAELVSSAVAVRLVNERGWHTIIEFAGGQAAVGRSLKGIAAIAPTNPQEIDATIWDSWSDSSSGANVRLRASVLPSEAGAMAAMLVDRTSVAGVELSCTVTCGALRIEFDTDEVADGRIELERIRATITARGGTMIVEAAPVAVKRDIDVFGEPGSDFEIMRRLKAGFDPQRTLSPGRFIGRL